MAARLGPPEVMRCSRSFSACSFAGLFLLVEDLVAGGLRMGGGEMSRARELGNTIIYVEICVLVAVQNRSSRQDHICVMRSVVGCTALFNRCRRWSLV